MKALVIREYGGPEVAVIEDVDDPVPGDGDLLVEVHAASVNPIDWKMREGYLRDVFPFDFPRILGRDFSGVVRGLGAGADDFQIGDAVYGTGAPLRHGSHAEMLAVASNMTAPKPAGLSYVEAAATGIGALTALAALDRDADIKNGDRVLIHAAAGGVGCYGVQYAVWKGAEVIATASAGNAEFVTELGADRVIDYRSEDFAAVVSDCDWVFDTVGGETHTRSQNVLKPGGTLLYINTGPLPDYSPRNDINIVDSMVPGGRDALDRLSALIAEGAIRPVVTATFPLGAANEAYQESQSGHSRGKRVLTMVD